MRDQPLGHHRQPAEGRSKRRAVEVVHAGGHARVVASPQARERRGASPAAPYARCVPQSAARTLTSPRMLLLHATGVAAVTIALLLSLWQYDAWRGPRAGRA